MRVVIVGGGVVVVVLTRAITTTTTTAKSILCPTILVWTVGLVLEFNNKTKYE